LDSIEPESAFHRTDAHEFYDKMEFEKRVYFFERDFVTSALKPGGPNEYK